MADGSDQEQQEAESVVNGLSGLPVVVSTENDFNHPVWKPRRAIIDAAAKSAAGDGIAKLICMGKTSVGPESDPCAEGSFAYRREAKPLREGFDGRIVTGRVLVCPRCGFAKVGP